MKNANLSSTYIQDKIDEHTKSRKLVKVRTKSSTIEGYILGYHTDDLSGTRFCEMWVNNAYPEIEKLKNNYFLLIPSEIEWIIVQSDIQISESAIRYFELP